MTNIRPILLLPIQKIVRALLQLPIAGPSMWRNIHKVRNHFANHLINKRFVTQYDDDIKINVSLSDHIESQIFWQGVQEGDRGEVTLLKSLFAPHHTFLDIGGNIGVFTLLAAKRLTKGAVHTFEPSLYHLEKMKANLQLNKFDNVHIHAVALSNRSAHSTLYFPPTPPGYLTNSGMASQFRFDQPQSKTEDITCVRLDDYMKSCGITSVHLMKIDVEGAEMDVLTGAIETIRSNRPHVVMEIDISHLRRAGRSVQEVIAYWNELQYRIFRIEHDAKLTPICSASDFVEHQNIHCEPCQLPEAAIPLT